MHAFFSSNLQLFMALTHVYDIALRIFSFLNLTNIARLVFQSIM